MPKSGPSSARKADRVSEDKAVPSPVCMAMRRVMFIGTLPQIETSPHKSRSATMIVLCDGLEFDRDQDLRWSQICQFRTTIRLESSCSGQLRSLRETGSMSALGQKQTFPNVRPMS